MYSYQYRLPDERLVTVRADRESEAASIVAGNFDGGDSARCVAVASDELTIPGWGTVGTDGDGNVTSCGEGASDPATPWIAASPPVNFRAVEAAFTSGASREEITRIALGAADRG